MGSNRKIKKLKRPLWLDWEGCGYFQIPREPVIPFPSDPLRDPTITWVSAFQHACKGDFRHVAKVTQIVRHEQMYYYDTCADLLGDAGPAAVFPELLAFIQEHDINFELTYSWCGAVSARGRLADVMTLVDAYEAHDNPINDDNDVILHYIAEMVDESEASRFGDLELFRDIDDYRKQLASHCAELAARFGGEEVLLWRGQPVSVRRMARDLLERGKDIVVPYWTRHRFEASTGIDCTAMFDRKGNFRPLQAAAIAEVFLDGPEQARYRDGVRYFFGHPVP